MDYGDGTKDMYTHTPTKILCNIGIHYLFKITATKCESPQWPKLFFLWTFLHMYVIHDFVFTMCMCENIYMHVYICVYITAGKSKKKFSSPMPL